MRISTLVIWAGFLLMTSACNSGGSSSPGGGGVKGIDAKAAGMEGVWIQKDEAEQLRVVGRIDSICEEIKKDKSTTIMNVRLIDANGGTYIYNPEFGKLEQLRMGVITPSREFAPSQNFEKEIGKANINVSIAGEVLSFNYKFGNGVTAQKYLKSSDAEARQYYSFQDSCRK